MRVDFSEVLKSQECIVCGTTFALTDSFERHLRQTQRPFQCPNGHGQNYTGQLEKEKLEVALKKATEEVESWKRMYRAANAASERLLKTANSLRGVIARMKKARGKRFRKDGVLA